MTVQAWHCLVMIGLFCYAPFAVGQDSQKPDPLRQARQAGLKGSLLRSAQTASSDSEVLKPSLDRFAKEILPVLRESCIDCHGPDATEGNIRIDTLDPDLFHGGDVDWWLEVLAALSKGEMPPPDEGELSDKNRSLVVEWLTSELHAASTVRRAEGGHSSFRRMTSYEYNYALQDLLALPYDFANDLPPEAISEDGFQNSSENLHMTVTQFSTYREIALAALRKATVRGEQPKPIYWGIAMSDAADDAWSRLDKKKREIEEKNKDKPEKRKQALERFERDSTRHHSRAHYKDLKSGRTGIAEWNYRQARYAHAPTDLKPTEPPKGSTTAVLPRKQRLIVELGDRIPEHGTLRVRFRAWQKDFPDPRAATLRLEFGWQASNDSRASVRIGDQDINVTATPDKPAFYQWDVPLSEVYPRNTMRGRWKLGGLPNPSEFLTFVNTADSHGDIEIDYVEVSGAVFDVWPPHSHTRLFFDSPNRDNEKQYAGELLRRFMTRAWRRRVSGEELDRKVDLFEKLRPKVDDFESAIIEVMATILASPDFLYLHYRKPSQPRRTRGQGSGLNGEELATRLAMFLWSSIPDDDLLAAAREDRLKGDQLRDQVRRMLADSRAKRFSRQYVRQWLGMQLLDYLQSDKKRFPHADDSLRESMQGEPIALFQHVLKNNLSVLDFIHSDYGIMNQRLARHYGLPNVWGNKFQRVDFSPEHQRGGMLTLSGLLAMNSDGKDSHPLKRGIWLLEKLLNDPPPPPPAAVPEIDLADPKIAQMTLKERIEDHRNKAACYSCHAKIDPWGIAFENFDALGGWRNEVDGKPVDAASELSNRQMLDGIEGVKRYLLAERQDQFVRAMVHKMTTYALGRPLTFADRSSVEQIAADLRKQGDGLATLVELIAMSELFRQP